MNTTAFVVIIAPLSYGYVVQHRYVLSICELGKGAEVFVFWQQTPLHLFFIRVLNRRVFESYTLSQ